MDQFNDEHSGLGGSYTVDASGKRVLQERTDHAVAEQAQAPADSAATKTTQPAVKGAKNG